MGNKSIITIIGAGNGGQAYAGFLANLGHKITLYDRDSNKISRLKKLGRIKLTGKVEANCKIALYTDKLSEAIKGAEKIYIVTVANVHEDIAFKLLPYIEENQIFVLSPGRTNGALGFYSMLKNNGLNKRIFISESQTLVFACRVIEDGIVNIIGIKEKVLIASLPKNDLNLFLSNINNDFSCFIPAKNVLQTSLENIGAILHPVITLMNAATIERGNHFYFYEDLTPKVTNLMEKIDFERIEIGKSLGIELHSVEEWVSFAYKNIKGNTLTEKIKNNPAYSKILGPKTLECRMLLEDIPTGLVPMIELAKLVNVDTPNIISVVNLSCNLLNIDFYKEGRILQNYGINGIDKLINIINYG